MKKYRISKNLSDTDMLAKYKEEPTFETETPKDEDRQRQPSASKAAQSLEASFFTPELQESVGKALLELKLKLFKEGIVDYKIKVSRQDNSVILTAIPISEKTKGTKK